MVDSKLDFKWSLNLLNGLNVLNSWANTSVATEDLLLFIRNNSSQWHLLKCLIDLHEDTVWVIDIFSESLGALITKPKILINMLILMISSEKHDLFGILKLESKEKADDFETVLTLVNVVTEEEIVIGMDVSSISWSLPDIKESHEILVLTHDVTNNLCWWSELLNHDWLSSQNLSGLVCEFDNVFPFTWEFCTWLNLLTFLWFQKWLQEHLAQGVIWVLVDLGVILLLRVQFLWLLGKLVDRDLSDDQ